MPKTRPARDITLIHRASDGTRTSRVYRTVIGTRRYAHKVVGPRPEFALGYAMSEDGVVVIQVIGARIAEIFPPP